VSRTDRPTHTPLPPGRGSELKVRVVSAVVLMAGALVLLWIGGWAFAVFVGIGAGLVLYEWASMARPYSSRVADKATIAFVAVSVIASFGDPLISLVALVAVASGITLFAAVDRQMRWLGVGILYAGVPGVAAVALRGQAPAGVISNGFFAITFVFLVVWATDSAAYFAGRAIGGVKLMPRVSPKKTWSGAIGGLIAAMLVGVAAGAGLADSNPIALALIAGMLSIGSQGGDLGESAMKRHFGVKDSGRLIPGHGGIMDRVDGLVVALTLAAAIGLVRSGGDDAAAGLLLW
jgi:phosphatidate cytidylyltransferase